MLKTKNKHLRYVITFFAVLCSSLLQTFVIESFVHSAGLLSGGFTGVAILIDRAASLYGGSISTSLALVALNLPVAVLCYRSISPRFTLFSLLQVGMTSLFLKYFSLPPIFDDILLSAVFGGFLMGISIVLALKGNASTGGTDFIALYVSNKTGKSIWSYVFMFNACILCIFGYLFGWLYAGYSILFQFISTKTVETFHHRYERLTLQITTQKAEEIMAAYVSGCRHGMSCVKAVGGYSHKDMSVLHTVISSYEESDIVPDLAGGPPCDHQRAPHGKLLRRLLPGPVGLNIKLNEGTDPWI